jgi:hypothetical protein
VRRLLEAHSAHRASVQSSGVTSWRLGEVYWQALVDAAQARLRQSQAEERSTILRQADRAALEAAEQARDEARTVGDKARGDARPGLRDLLGP